MKAKIGNTEYRLVLSPMTGNRLPKRSNGTVAVKVNGVETLAPVTNNKMWAAPDKVLYYIWVEVEGKAYYLTLDYNQAPTAGAEITTADGVAERVDPARITKDEAKEAKRVAAFKVTWAAR